MPRARKLRKVGQFLLVAPFSVVLEIYQSFLSDTYQ